MNTKNFILGVSVIGCLVAYALFHTRQFGICEIYCGPGINQYQNMFLFFPFILLFSLITYRLSNIVFQSWWKFTRVAAPIVFSLSFLISLELHHNPAGEFQDIFDLPALFLLYFIFTTGSIIVIIRAYRNANN